MGWVVNATLRPHYPRERSDSHCIGGWVSPKAGLGGVRKFSLHRDLIPGPSSPYWVVIPTTLYIGKVKPLSTPFERSRCIFVLLIILGTRWSFIANSRAGHFTCGRDNVSYSPGAWVGLNNHMEVLRNRKSFPPCQESNTRSSSP